MWEIRESDESKRFGHRMGRKYSDSEIEEAYECGFEDGYEKAMKEIHYGERRGRY
jgi:hypothetical protein